MTSRNQNSQKWPARILNIALILVFALATPVTGFAQQSTPFTATPLTPDSTYSAEKLKVAQQVKTLLATQKQGNVSVIVKLKGDSLAAYQGDVPGLAATNPDVTGESRLNLLSNASKAYLKHLEGIHSDFLSAASKNIGQARVSHNYEVIMNSVAMTVPSDQVANLYALPEVEAVYPDALLQPDTDNSPQFIGATTVWKQLGGQEKSGEGVIVGVLDTGIWPEHPSFSDPDPSGKPYAPPPATSSGTPRACQFGDKSNPNDANFTCNNKLIGAERFMSTYDLVVGPDAGGFTSARDAEGHGTHTSSTAAGNAAVAASIYGIPRGIISGIAPRAYIMMYKVCGFQGCFSSDSAAAVEQAILDGVNVINFSIGGGANPYGDAVEMAFLDAYNAGIFVAASAGNSGPTADTTDHRGPWVTTVAASTENRSFNNTVTLTADGANLTLHGTSITGGVGPLPVTVPTANPYCIGAFDAGSVAGQIVVCERGGGPGRAEKGFNVLQGGAAGMILYNQNADTTDQETDNHYLPTTHIQYADGVALLAFLSAHPSVQGTITQGVKAPSQGDIMASFSSRGGPAQTLGVSKPDITAPGVQILAGNTPIHTDVADGPQGEYFQAIAGTSMASPHIAGSGALLKALHPNWTPGQIKSALMTTAWTQVVKEDGSSPANAFDDGSGRVDLTKAGDPGLTFDVTAADYMAHAADLWNVNYPSLFIPTLTGAISVDRTAHSVLNRPSSWLLQVKGATDFQVYVQPLLIIKAGGNSKFSIAIDAKNVPVGQVRMATLYLSEIGVRDPHVLHMPITFVRTRPNFNLAQTCSPATIKRNATTTCTVTFENTSFSPATVKFLDVLPLNLQLQPKSVTGAKVLPANLGITYSGNLAPAQPPDISIGAGSTPGGGYLALADYGITPVSGVGDETISNFTVPAFTYGGESYTRIGVVSNGYVVVGGGTGADINYLNQQFPDATPPNNVLAPFWTDFNPSAGGEVRVGELTDGANSWIVIDYAAVKEYSTAATDTFEVWIGLGAVQDISYGYGPINGNGDGGLMTVGAENRFGNRGVNVYYNGTGTLPTEGTGLVVNSAPGTPGDKQTITFTAKGVSAGTWTNYAQLTSNLYQGIDIAPFSGTVTK